MINLIKRNKINILIVFIFLILPFLFFNDSIKITSLIFGKGDPNYQTLPFWDLIVTSVKSGEFPFWNKYIFSGFPYIINSGFLLETGLNLDLHFLFYQVLVLIIL
jgi:hypothetical protein